MYIKDSYIYWLVEKVMEKIKIDVVKIIINTTKKYKIGLIIHMKIN